MRPRRLRSPVSGSWVAAYSASPMWVRSCRTVSCAWRRRRRVLTQPMPATTAVGVAPAMVAIMRVSMCGSRRVGGAWRRSRGRS